MASVGSQQLTLTSLPCREKHGSPSLHWWENTQARAWKSTPVIALGGVNSFRGDHSLEFRSHQEQSRGRFFLLLFCSWTFLTQLSENHLVLTITLPSVGTHRLSAHILQPEGASPQGTSLSVHLLSSMNLLAVQVGVYEEAGLHGPSSRLSRKTAVDGCEEGAFGA